MMRLAALFAAGLLLAACSDDEPTGGGGAAGTTSSDTGGSGGTSTGTSSATGGGGSGGDGGDGSGGEAGAAGSAVGNPELFTEPVFEMDFSVGTNGQFRANGGAWEDFESWSHPGVDGGWDNAGGVWVQTTDAVRTMLLPNGLGDGRVLHTWIEAGDDWTSSSTYPRTELISDYAEGMAFGGEYRLEMAFYAEGDITTSGRSIIGFQLHQPSGSGSPPVALFLADGGLQFRIRDAAGSEGTWTIYDLFTLAPDSLVEIVLELQFGYAVDGAYARLWVNGTPYVDITDRDLAYPDAEANAGYWKFCSLYDWDSFVETSRSVLCGPTFKLAKRP